MSEFTDFLKRESALQALIILLGKFGIVRSRFTHEKPFEYEKHKFKTPWISAFEIEYFAKHQGYNRKNDR